MRLALLLAAALLLASPALAQTDPYQWVGNTTTLYDGSGNGLGFVGMTSQCRAEFGPGARMCTSQEILESDTLNFNAIPAEGCWIHPKFQPLGADDGTALDASGIRSDPRNLSCLGWEGSFSALYLQPTGSFGISTCTETRSVACCAPTPVPGPTSSLPIGTLGLAVLASLRN